MTREEKLSKKVEWKKAEKIHLDMVDRQILNKKLVKKAPDGVCISFRHINKIYPNHTQAVFDFNLDIKEKEFIVFVGPSGCGKSTTLRMLAGLEEITYGDLFIDGKYANDLMPKERDVAMVFQNYALYPNMTVYDNMAFSLQARRYDKNEIDVRVREAAEILEIEDYLDEKPANLSGGQRQRVALGRAIVRNAKVFLMDEPLSNLDAKLRVQMRSEIVKLHNRVGATTVYVTHDQTEAMTMASRIVVMRNGYVQQIGAPKEIYDNPDNVFVARFIGNPAMNIIDCQVQKNTLSLPNGLSVKLSAAQLKQIESFYGGKIESIESKIKSVEKDIEERRYEMTHPQYVKDVLSMDKEKNSRAKRVNKLSERIKKLKRDKPDEYVTAMTDELDVMQKELADFIEREEERIKNTRYPEVIPKNADAVFEKDDYLLIYSRDLIRLREDLERYSAVTLGKNYPLLFGVRPEEIFEAEKYQSKSAGSDEFTVKVVVAELLGREYFVHFYVGESDVIAKINTENELSNGDELKLKLDLKHMHLFDAISEERII